MMRMSSEKHEVQEFAGEAEAIAKRHDASSYKPASTGYYKAGEEEAKAAAEASGRTGEDLSLLAIEGAALAYDLTPEQREMLLPPDKTDLPANDLGDYMYYHMQDGKPVYTVRHSLHQKFSDDPNVFPPFTEKDGVYWVDVNVETGMIENILYDTELGGNG